jgi:hypothetical protein
MWASVHQPSSSHGDPDPGIVRRAAAVLEEELAASPLREHAATVLSAERAGGAQPPTELASVLDALGQALCKIVGRLQAIAEGAPVPDDQTPLSAPMPAAREPVLQVSHQAHAGDIAELKIGLANDSAATMDIELCWTDLVAGPIDRIAQSQLTLQPDRLRLEPERDAEVIVRVHLPSDTPSGTYTGLVRVARSADHVVLVTIHVV